jgi:signal transduction histidine kinase/tetratricopeptide (TPR) repeat protein
MDVIEGVSMTENVVDLLNRKLDRLPASVQRLLTLAACVGNRFDVGTLATVCELPLRSILDELGVATHAGLIAAESESVFGFAHDRVQQAAYARIAPADRPRVHLLVGRLLWARHAEDGSDIASFDGIFETASHLNLGVQLIDDHDEMLALARLNRAAGAKAKASAAYRAALGYFAAGRDLLAEEHWQSHYALAFDLHFEAAQCEYLCGNFDDAARDLEALLARAGSDLDRARVVSLQAIHHENLARYDDALASARKALALLHVVLPTEAAAKESALQSEIGSIDRRLGARPIASLIDLPPMVDPTKRLVMRILVDAWSSAYILGDATLARLLSATLVRFSLEHGNAEESAYGYVTHAITAGPVRGDYVAAGEWGQLAIAVNQRFNDRRLRAKVYQQYHAHVEPWRSPFARCIEHAKEACRSGLESGDFLYAAYGAATESWPAFAASQDLVQFRRDMEPNLALVQQLKNTAFADALRLMLGWARALQEAGTPITLTGPDFDEERYIATYRDNPFFSLFHRIARLQVCYTLDDLEGAAGAATAVRTTAASLTGMLWSAQFEFWNGMRLAAEFATATPAQREQARDELTSAERSLAALAESCPANFGCFALLLKAELARVSDQPFEALELYEQAVACADDTRHVQQQALANERCGRYWLERGNRKVAGVYLQSAVEAYARWGARAKVRRLLAAYPGVLGAIDASRLSGEEAPKDVLQALDVATLGRAAQAIGESDEWGAALRRMLSIAIQNAGASRGVLIEVRDGETFVLAEGDAETHAVGSLDDAPTHSRPERSSSAIVNAVLRSGSHLLVAEPAIDTRFVHDEYLATNQPKAVLCVPGMHQGRPAAVLYLENRFARDAFNVDRVEVIQILAAQAALGLVGARMLERMQREMTERQRAEQQLRAIDEGLSSATGSDFFRALVRNVAHALQVRYAFVAECVPATNGSGVVARACAFWNGDDFGPSFEYNLAGTPCQQVVEGGRICHFASDLQTQFPADRALVRWKAQSYLGMPLVGSNDEVIGHLVVLDTEAMPDATTAISLLRLSAGRAGAELERMKADQGLQRAMAEVEQLKNRLQEENVYLRRELIANVSHDLRSPLASLRGYLETLQIKEQTLTAAERRSYLSIAARQAEHLQELISELFDLARLDFTGYRIAAEPLHLGELARDVLQKFQLAARKKGVTLFLEVPDSLGLVQADIGLMERTLENLLGNAIAHTPAKGQVRLVVSPGSAGSVTVEVSDTGVGIPREDLPRIFERFYRVDKARSLASEGSGLGLAIVKRIVELHASEIQVQSEVGTGTRFWFTLAA